MSSKKIIIINGPNLNLLGKREPELYGSTSFEDYYHDLMIRYPDTEMEYHQTNHEGTIIDLLHQFGFDAKGIILNAGGYTHTSISIGDAVKGIDTPVIEVHISDIKKREAFRQHSYLEAVCVKQIQGKGLDGYEEALQFFI